MKELLLLLSITVVVSLTASSEAFSGDTTKHHGYLTTTILPKFMSASPENMNEDKDSFSTRRTLLQNGILASLVSLFPSASFASENEGLPLVQERSPIIKPRAPLESMFPAARVKRIVDRSSEIASALSTEAIDRGDELLSELSDLLLSPPKLLERNQRVPIKPGRLYMDSYQQSRQQTPLLAKPGALLVENGELLAWKRLQKREQYQESQDEIRKALNVYTNALQFDPERYVLTAPALLRKELIREDRLPDIKNVIAADLDLRVLYRNELLTAWQDARAELQYQLAQKGDLDLADLIELLWRAKKASDQWFSFVDQNDLQEAMKALKAEATS